MILENKVFIFYKHKFHTSEKMPTIPAVEL